MTNGFDGDNEYMRDSNAKLCRRNAFFISSSKSAKSIEGGVVVTSDEALSDDLRSMRSHGLVRDRSDRDDLAVQSATFDDRFLFATTGYNVRPTELNAAIGLVQLERLPSMLASRAALAGQVVRWVDRIPWLRLVGAEWALFSVASDRT